MERSGLIVRTSVEQDARLKKIVLTEKSMEYNQAVLADLEAFERELTRDIPHEDLEVFERVVEKMIRNLS